MHQQRHGHELHVQQSRRVQSGHRFLGRQKRHEHGRHVPRRRRKRLGPTGHGGEADGQKPLAIADPPGLDTRLRVANEVGRLILVPGR